MSSCILPSAHLLLGMLHPPSMSALSACASLCLPLLLAHLIALLAGSNQGTGPTSLYECLALLHTSDCLASVSFSPYASPSCFPVRDSPSTFSLHLAYPLLPAVSARSLASSESASCLCSYSSCMYFMIARGSAGSVPSSAFPLPKYSMVPLAIFTVSIEGEDQPILINADQNAPAPPATAA